MRIIRVLLVFIGLTIGLFAQKITIEDVINEFDKNSSYAKTDKVEKERLAIEKTGSFYDKYLKLNLSTKAEHNYYADEAKTPQTLKMLQYAGESVARYPGNYSISATYDFLTIGGAYDFSTNKFKTMGFNIGISKSINDLFYDDYRYKENLMSIKEKQTENILKGTRLSKIENIIDIYTRIKSTEIEAALKQNQMAETKEQLGILSEKEKIGEAVKLDIEYLEIEIEAIKGDVLALESSMKTEKKKLANEANFKDDGYELEPLKDIEQGIKTTDYDLKNKLLEIDTERENVKYYNRQKQVTFTPSLNYETENKTWKVGFEVSGNIFNYNTESKSKAKLIEKLEIEKADIEKNVVVTRELKEENFKAYSNKLKIYENKRENRRKRFAVIKQMKQKGYVAYTEYLKESNLLQEAELNYEKLRNEFNGFKYKMLYVE